MGWAVSLMGVVVTSCVTLVHPRGAWFRPHTVPWSESTMRGVRVAILCGSGDREEESWRIVPSAAGCDGLAAVVRNLGAQVVPPPQAQAGPSKDAPLPESPAAPDKAPDMTLVYIDRTTAIDRCWASSPLVILSLSLFPCLEDLETRAELRILDERGALMRREILDAHILNVYGLGALPLLVGRVTQDDFAKTLRRERRLVQHVTDLIVTDRVRQNVAAAARGGSL